MDITTQVATKSLHSHQCKICGRIFACDDYCTRFGGKECPQCTNFAFATRF